MSAGRGTMAGMESPARTNASAASSDTILLLYFPDPDVPVPGRVTVVLQEEGQPVRVWLVARTPPVHRPTGDHRVVLHQHAVVQHRDPRRVPHGPVGREAGPSENDVVGLPLAWGSARVHERRRLTVYGPGLAVGVGLVVVRIEYLDLVVCHQDHAAVATLLTFTLRRRGRRPLDVELHVAEAALGRDRPGVGRSRPSAPSATCSPTSRGRRPRR